MLDSYGRKYINPIILKLAKLFVQIKISANVVTTLALIIGILSAVFLYFSMPILSLIFLWVSGYLDSVDGTIARLTNSTSPYGTLMDITFDRLVETGIILVTALNHPDVAFYLLLLTVTILISMTIFLTVGALAKNNGFKSFKYQIGLAERTEGFIMFSAMILFQSHLKLIISLFLVMMLITIYQRFAEGLRILK
ncbi:CDP-alcohol phosphatidyltransferase family protein [uncultured Clostridium sp.]|uniref:CDP-alcohol phosphatidyltransferase family protein n=1 Tax=uncultured Clostridium sp. TaxID=59620 RepID=UPI00260E54CC|nr:CDP-alcohol phosphatidyltransferase family protein [uncultured Clostridium sp.]